VIAEEQPNTILDLTNIFDTMQRQNKFHVLNASTPKTGNIIVFLLEKV
jgi:hypothetical protein